MGRGLGSTQRKILAALQTPCEECNRVTLDIGLGTLVKLVTQTVPCPCYEPRDAPPVSGASYASIARAVSSLERRGLLTSYTVRDGCMSFEIPGKHGHGLAWKHVRLSVEHLETLPSDQHLDKRIVGIDE